MADQSVKRKKLMSEYESQLYVQVINNILAAKQAAKIAESSLKELSDEVGDELTWRAYQDFCSIDNQKFEVAEQGVLESRCRFNERRLEDFIHIDLITRTLFKFLPLKQILNLRLVSKTLNTHIKRLSPQCQIWKIDLNIFSPLSPPPDFFYTAGTDLEIRMDSKLTSFQNEVIGKCSHRIVSLREESNGPASFFLDDIPTSVCNEINRLETLRSVRSTKNNVILLNQSSRSLKNVEISELPNDVTQIRNDFTSLQSLKVYKNSTYNIDAVIPIVKTRPSVLTSLSIEETSSMKAFVQLDHELKCLQKLHISWDFDIDDGDMQGAINLINKSPNLMDLHLERVGDNIDELSVCPQIKNITSLTMQPGWNDDKDFFYHSQFLNCCTGLTNLKLDVTFFGSWKLAKREEWYLPSVKKAQIKHKNKYMYLNHVKHHFSKEAEIDLIFDEVMYDSELDPDSDND